MREAKNQNNNSGIDMQNLMSGDEEQFTVRVSRSDSIASGIKKPQQNLPTISSIKMESTDLNQWGEDIQQENTPTQQDTKSTGTTQFAENMTILQCFWLVTQIASPPILGMLVYILIQLINTYFIGNLNEPVLLAGVGMGNMLINVLAFAIMQGLNGALETLVSHSNGAGEYQMCGVYLNRAKFICTCLMLPILFIFLYSDSILVALHQTQEIAEVARTYCCILLPGVWAMGLFDATRKFLTAQFEVKIPLYTQIFTMVVHLILCWLLVEKAQMREVGAALATNVTFILNYVIAVAWCMRKENIKRTWVFPDSRTFMNLGSFLKIGIPGALMLCFEWWVFELLAIFSGLMGVAPLAAEVIVINVVTFIFMIPLGTSYASSAFTGYFLGEGKIDQAKKYSALCILFNCMLTVIVIVILGVFTEPISRLFTQDGETVEITADVMGILLVYIFFDTIHGVQSGIIRGLGLQIWGSIYTLICYWAIGMTLALIFGFTLDLGVKGLWIGMTIACVILDTGFQCIISCRNWSDIATKIRNQVNEDNLNMSNSKETVELPRSVPTTPEGKAFKRRLIEQQRTQESVEEQIPMLGPNANKSPALGKRTRIN